MNKKKIRAHRKKRRFCEDAIRTRETNGLQDAKMIYDTEEEAWEVIRARPRNAVLTLENFTPYLCRPSGDHYHIGRRAKQPDDTRKGLLETLRQIPGASRAPRNA